MNENPVRIQVADGIEWITLERPDALNAMTVELLDKLALALDEAQSSDAVRAIVITGAGNKAFSAGADIRYLEQATALEVRELALKAIAINHQIETLGKVVIAAINGYALGGGLELAEACTIRIAVRHAMMGHPEVRIGAVAGFGGTTRLPRLIGKGRAAEILLTGRQITAQEALEYGLVNRVVESDELLPEAERLAREILAQSPLAVRMTWEAIHRGMSATQEESTQLGADYFGLVAGTEDFRTGTRSFLNKTRPDFSGR